MRYRELLQRARPTGAVARILSGSVAGQGILIAISPLLTRIYSPSDFGALAIITALASVISSFVTLCWEAAIVLPRSTLLARTLGYLGVFSTVALSTAIAVLSYIWRYDIGQALGTDILVSYWWVAPLTVLVIGTYKVATSWIIRMQKYHKIALRNLTQGVGQAVCNLLLGLIGLVPLGLILGLAAGRASALLGILGRDSFFTGRFPSWRAFRIAAIRYRRFPLVTTWSYTINSLGLQLPIILLTFVYGAYTIGFLALTIRVLASPVSIVADAVSQSFEGVIGERIRTRTYSLVPVIRQIITRLALAVVAPSLLIIFIAPPLFAWVFGEEWRVAGSYAQIMMVGYAAQFVVAPISKGMMLLERQGLQLWWDVSRAVLTSGAVVTAGYLGLPITWALALLAGTQCVSYAALLLLTIWLAHKRDAEPKPDVHEAL